LQRLIEVNKSSVHCLGRPTEPVFPSAGVQNVLKGLGHQINIVLRPTKSKLVLSVHAQMVLKFLGWDVKPKNDYKVSACFL
jgi:hypothetical protein